MGFRDVRSLARHYNTKRKRISKWLIVAAIIVGLVFSLFFSNFFVMPIALCVAFALNTGIYYALKKYSESILFKLRDPQMYKEILLDGYGDTKGKDLLKAAYYCGDFQTVVNICYPKTENDHFIYLARMFFDLADTESLRRVCDEFEQYPQKCNCEVMNFFKAFCSENYEECRNICNDRILQNKQNLFKVQWAFYRAVTDYRSGDKESAVEGFESVIRQGKYLNYAKIASGYLEALNENREYVADVVIPEPDVEYKLPKSKPIFGWKHLAVFLIACSICPAVVAVYNGITSDITYKMKKALSTQYSGYEYIDHVDVMQGEKILDTLCFFRTSEGDLSMVSLITFNEEEWYIFFDFGPVYEGFNASYVDPHYRYMSDIYFCEKAAQVPSNAYLTYELNDNGKTLYVYIGNVFRLSDYESDMWYKTAMMEKRSYELEALVSARYFMTRQLDDFNILDFAWIRKDLKFVDYLCAYSTSESELNVAIFSRDSNQDVSFLYNTFTDLKVGKVYTYTEFEKKYVISYCFYKNKLDAPKNSYYLEEIQVNGRDLWLAVVDVQENLAE